jgi:hypothetical protein
MLGPAGSSPAEEGRLPAPGATVRLAIDAQTVRLVGRLVSADALNVVLRPSGLRETRSIRREAIAAVDVAHSRPLLGLGSGVLAGAVGGFLLSRHADEGALGSAAAGAALALPAAALGTVLASREQPTAAAAMVGAAVDGVALGIALDGWCRGGIADSADGGCFLGAALVGGAIGAVSGGIAAHVAHRRWSPVWARATRVSVAARGHGVAVLVRLAF